VRRRLGLPTGECPRPEPPSCAHASVRAPVVYWIQLLRAASAPSKIRSPPLCADSALSKIRSLPLLVCSHARSCPHRAAPVDLPPHLHLPFIVAAPPNLPASARFGSSRTGSTLSSAYTTSASTGSAPAGHLADLKLNRMQPLHRNPVICLA
jgi:hypothetical protein